MINIFSKHFNMRKTKCRATQTNASVGIVRCSTSNIGKNKSPEIWVKQIGGVSQPLGGTSLKFNMEPENGPLEKEIPFGNHHFQVLC